MTDGGDIRDEAERLVSATLAVASFALRGRRAFSTGTDECCVCPVCRGIAAVRNPSPQMMFTVARGATTVPSGIASALRGFSAVVPPPPPPAPTPRDPGATWRSATRTEEPPPPPPADDDPWGAATRAAE